MNQVVGLFQRKRKKSRNENIDLFFFSNKKKGNKISL